MDILARTSALQQDLYEIQELRHARDDRLGALVARVAQDVERLAAEVPEGEHARAEWDKVHSRFAILREEMKEDGWLVRFRTTAEQAEAMVETLVKSGDSLASADKNLEQAYQTHTSMRATYTPSITKILKMMARSLADRTTINGEALRLHGDLRARWDAVQATLLHLEARVQIALMQGELGGMSLADHGSDRNGKGGQEVLLDKVSGARTPVPKYGNGLGYAPPSTGLTPRRPSSSMSQTPDRPRWNASTKTRPSYGTPSRAISPTPSMTSALTSASRARSSLGARQSYGRQSLGSRAVPGLAVSTTTSRITISDPIPPVPPMPTLTPSRRSTRAPQSAYRSSTPLPSHSARPASRQSLATPADPSAETPFVASKYDLLDTHVERIVAETAFELFVARLDAPLRRGQRKADGEEWKGTFVFGAGERGVPVKLVFIGKAGGKTTKCLARMGGLWMPLEEILRGKMEAHGEVF